MRMSRLAVVAALCFASLVPAVAQQTSETGDSVVYIFRHGGILGDALNFPVSVDGKRIGDVHNGHYIAADVPAGSHLIELSGSTGANGDRATIVTEPGKSYFLTFSWHMGFIRTPIKLKLIDPDEGMKMVSKLKPSSPETPRALN